VYNYTYMTAYERKKLEIELRDFTARNFEKPGQCRNTEQIRFYVKELCARIEDYQERFSYVPDWAYGLLAQYNARQNALIEQELRNAYPV
jgi:hypothetical protein